MTSTEWKSPLNITQDARYKVVNGGTANKWGELNNLKRVTTDNWTYIVNNGIANYRASPVIYCSNFNFSIPSDAKITKIHVRYVAQEKTIHPGVKTSLLKLKIGASTTDFGVGKNNANGERWPSAGKSWITHTMSYTPEQWTVSLNPTQVNSTNFGCVFQCVGLDPEGQKGYPHWSYPRVAYFQMKIDYDLPLEQTVIEEAKFSVDASVTSSPLDLNAPNVYNQLSITFKHIMGTNKKYNAGNTPNLTVKSDGLLIGVNKGSSCDVPTFIVPEEKVSTTYSTSVNIYPNLKLGKQLLIVEGQNFKKQFVVNVVDSGGTPTLVSTDEDSQQLVLNNCKFVDCSSEKEGGAGWIRSSHATLKGNVCTNCVGNVACNNFCLNNDCNDGS